MRVSYNKLWKMLIDKNMKKMDLLEAIEMSPNTLAKLGRNEDVSMDPNQIWDSMTLRSIAFTIIYLSGKMT